MKKKIKIFPLSLVFVLIIASLGVMFVVSPKQERSVNEKRILATFPELTLDSLKSGEFTSELDTYLADHFPLRDTFVGINAYANLALGQNGDSGIYKGDDGYLITAPYKFDETQVEKNIKCSTAFFKGTGLKSNLMIVPTAGYIMDNVMPKNHKAYHDKDVFNIVNKYINGADFINLEDSFNSAKADTQLYYKTDHHLTSQGAMVMYNEFCKANGLEQKSFTLDKTVGGFYGTTYSKSGLWLTKPDDVEIYKCDSNNSYTVSIDDGDGFKDYDSLYFEDHLNETDKYPVFVDGNHGLVKIKNNNLNNGKRLLLIKDSYAHCFSTFLIENYEEIVMVDLRYYHKSMDDLIKEYDLNEILVLYGAENFATSKEIVYLAM